MWNRLKVTPLLMGPYGEWSRPSIPIPPICPLHRIKKCRWRQLENLADWALKSVFGMVSLPLFRRLKKLRLLRWELKRAIKLSKLRRSQPLIWHFRMRSPGLGGKPVLLLPSPFSGILSKPLKNLPLSGPLLKSGVLSINFIKKTLVISKSAVFQKIPVWIWIKPWMNLRKRKYQN